MTTENNELTKEDFESETWIKLEKELRHLLYILRQQNDNNNDIEGTSFIRGGIFSIKRLIQLNPANENEDL